MPYGGRGFSVVDPFPEIDMAYRESGVRTTFVVEDSSGIVVREIYTSLPKCFFRR